LTRGNEKGKDYDLFPPKKIRGFFRKKGDGENNGQAPPRRTNGISGLRKRADERPTNKIDETGIKTKRMEQDSTSRQKKGTRKKKT